MQETTKKVRKDFTPEQKLFIVGKKELAKLEEIAKERPLTYEEKNRMDYIKQKLFESIVRFGMSEAKTMMSKYMIDNDAYMEVHQSLAAMFFKKLPDYNPFLTTPTTFFVRYFRQVITEYLLDNSQHLSQYDAHNVSRVRAAIRYYESRGILWDEAMLSNKTGLTPKVLKQTLYFATNSKRAQVEDAQTLKSHYLTPEEEFIQQEMRDSISNALTKSLTPEEIRFLRMRLNPEGDKEMPFQTMANILEISVRDVKKKYNSIIAKLHSNDALQKMNSGRIGKDESTNLNLQDRGSDLAESFLFDSITKQ